MERGEVTKATAAGAEALRPLLIHDLAVDAGRSDNEQLELGLGFDVDNVGLFVKAAIKTEDGPG